MEEKKLVPKRRFKGFDGEWKEIDLRSIGSTLSGLSGKTKKDFGHGTAEFVTYMNVFNNTIADINITEKVVRDDKQTQLKYGDILFTTSSETPNEVGMSSVWLDDRPNVYLNSFCFGFRTSINIDYYYIGYMLRANPFRKQIEILAQGISRYNISKTKVLKIEVLLPSLQEQQKIGEFFKILDERIANQERKIAKVKALKSAYLTELFPQEGKTVPKRRFKGFAEEWGERLVNEIGNSVYGGGTPKTTKDQYWGGCIPWIQSSDITDDLLYINTPGRTITEVGLAKSAAKLVPANSIAIVTRVGVGKLAFMPYEYSTSQDFLSISNLNVDYQFGAYVMYNLLKKEKESVQGTSIKGITKDELLSMKLMIPNDKEEQQKIGEFFKNLDDQITTEEKKLEKLKKMKEAYLEEMFL